MKDLFKECFDERVPANEFKETFCSHCRNPVCTQAGWGKDKFGARVSNQESRRVNPSFADPNNPKYNSLQKRDFPSLFREAIRLERADSIGDWSLPEENVVLAPIEPTAATDESQDLVEKAVESLRKDGVEDQEDQADQEVGTETAPEAPEAQSPGSTNPSAAEDAKTPARSNDDFLTPESKENEHLDQPLEETPRRTTQGEGQKNTHFEDGQMLGGDQPRQDFDEVISNKMRVLDSWGSDGKIHEPGTTVKMGKKK